MTNNRESNNKPHTPRPNLQDHSDRRRIWQRAAVAAYFLLLSYLLLTPHPLWFLGRTGNATEDAVDESLADYVQHALAYAVLGALITWATEGESRRQRWGWLAAAMAHGVICEFLQHFIPHRHFGGHDALANAAGVLAGWGITVIVCRIPRVRAIVAPVPAADSAPVQQIARDSPA